MLWLCVAGIVPAALAGKNFVKPTAKSAINYPAHDFHRDEQVAIAADPYDNPEKAKIFSTNFAGSGLLPIFFVVTNDGDQPISLTSMKPELVTASRAKLSPATTDDLYRRLSHPARNDSPYPLPFPRKKIKGAVGKQAMQEIESAQFRAKAVEPHTTQSGFLFFDITGISTPLAGAHFYLTGLRDAKGNEVMYFEVPLEKYLRAPASKP